MSSSILIKVFWTALIAAGSAYEIYANDQTEKGLNPSVKAPRYPAYAEGYALPIIFLWASFSKSAFIFSSCCP